MTARLSVVIRNRSYDFEAPKLEKQIFNSPLPYALLRNSINVLSEYRYTSMTSPEKS